MEKMKGRQTLTTNDNKPMKKMNVTECTLNPLNLTKPACRVRFASTYKLLKDLISSECMISNHTYFPKSIFIHT